MRICWRSIVSSGKLLWETTLPADDHQPYGGTIAPLVVNDTVIVGVAGGDHGVRGFAAAYKVDTRSTRLASLDRRYGDRRRFHLVNGLTTIRHQTLFIGQPATHGPIVTIATAPGTTYIRTACWLLMPKRAISNGTINSRRTTLKDRDATEPNVLVDTVYKEKPSKLLLHADRNGFFYVLDRTNGKLIFAKPFLHRVDWASSIGSDGKPVVVDPRGCPSDAANWDSTAYSPETRLYYVMALEECTGKPTG